MGILLFLLTAGALSILAIPLLTKEKFLWRTIGSIFISSVILAVNGIYESCKDNWPSQSIGQSGACSRHGGVVTRLNDFGRIILVASLVIIIGSYLLMLYKDHREEKRRKRLAEKK